ncbi:hypothetical protein [uncultured Friedmanniella sp.]|uniref:hypothetical protein n=1 Tax=uncultured Friedmanniella sp. TaxID=335381 RepID=UPI0035CB8736
MRDEVVDVTGQPGAFLGGGRGGETGVGRPQSSVQPAGVTEQHPDGDTEEVTDGEVEAAGVEGLSVSEARERQRHPDDGPHHDLPRAVGAAGEQGQSRRGEEDARVQLVDHEDRDDRRHRHDAEQPCGQGAAEHVQQPRPKSDGHQRPDDGQLARGHAGDPDGKYHRHQPHQLG